MTDTRNTSREGEFLPCPFCGVKPALYSDDLPKPGEKCVTVECIGNPCTNPTAYGSTAEEATELWNTRTHPAPTPPVGREDDLLLARLNEAVTNASDKTCSYCGDHEFFAHGCRSGGAHNFSERNGMVVARIETNWLLEAILRITTLTTRAEQAGGGAG